MDKKTDLKSLSLHDKKNLKVPQMSFMDACIWANRNGSS